MKNKKITVGRIDNPYGIFGWVHMISFTEKKKNIFNYFSMKLNPSNREYQKKDLLNWKKHVKNYIIRFKNIHTRTDAYNISKQDIIIQSKQLPNLKKNEYYWNDILSCNIYNIHSQCLGTVVKIFDNIYYDVLVINRKNSQNNILYIPFIIPDIIKKIDLIKKIIIIKWIT
ncbi:16S rRNA-processing protein [Buchnera aphidicola (Cinara tujafilina)]|uniref:Ribosome maturation factor RimM n=1 Tax=Buchnera aphidicola (Cinara tujafilina) TaxID=261317 RepID=F7WZH7_9GAMM|nr:ribosome maturation factor RimM [Buchnera aphidicola]AEH39841.1 16S rRNA-processing protein [Buchnera aphidicola (Cinara tujafilina)]